MALAELFGFGHTQSDNVRAKKSGPMFIQNANTLKSSPKTLVLQVKVATKYIERGESIHYVSGSAVGVVFWGPIYITFSPYHFAYNLHGWYLEPAPIFPFLTTALKSSSASASRSLPTLPKADTNATVSGIHGYETPPPAPPTRSAL